ncbi:MAG: hypothetical protein RR295_01265 [Oscillospiraceae bacterium]
MLFKQGRECLKIEVLGYEFPTGGAPGSDDANWLSLRGTYTAPDGTMTCGANSCLLASETAELAAGLKVLAAGVTEDFLSRLQEPYFELAAESDGETGFLVSVTFVIPLKNDDVFPAELEVPFTKRKLLELAGELEETAEKYPPRV